MRFEFDTTDGEVAVHAALAFFGALAGYAREPQASVGNGASDTAAPPSSSEVTGTHQATEASTESVEDASAPVTDVTAKPARVRRTKAQIEADNIAAEKAFADKQIPIQLTQGQQDAVDDTAGILTAEQRADIQAAVDGKPDVTIVITDEQVKQIVDLDGLRTALQTYTGKHDLAAGIALLGTFECKRISDVLNISAEKQQAFLLACNV